MDLWSAYNYYLYELADARVRDWLFVGPSLSLLAVTSFYLYCILYWLPNFMKQRPAYSLRGFSRVYDLSQIVINASFVYRSPPTSWIIPLWNTCPPYDYSYDPTAYKMAILTWMLLTVKVFDYVETIIFLLRKKSRQVSFLHVYHHVSTVVLAWFAATYYSGGMTTIFLSINACVHVIMYTYYFFTTFGPSVRRFTVMCKPAITMIQMVQFCIMIAFCLPGFSIKCRQFMPIATFLLTNLSINYILFYNFYQQNYKKPKIT
ncbi:hypothetical protein KM043_000842 [Ampulex compressa]|nr:hypothetical protein KM043_000842 [Ampulex compressa]